jgi:hypothetical protein
MLDRNRDNRLTQVEAAQRGPIAGRFEVLLQLADKNKDQAISLEEFLDARNQMPDLPGRGSAEYYMPDLDNPASRGTLIEPKFFVDGSHLPAGSEDLERRSALARSITDPHNPWFARAFVNRIWTELFGQGFYNPVDDLGPQRTCVSPEVLEALCQGFIANDYDISWLFRTITNTRAYQRAVGERQPGDTSPAFAAAVPTRLRSDQIYQAVLRVLGVEGLGGRGRISGQLLGTTPLMMRQTGISDPGRLAFFQLFNFDPSTPQDEILGTIPQALFLMNSPAVQQFLSANSGTVLTQILREFPEDDDALSELYLRVLSREPTAEEVAICREHIAAAATRPQAYEDILWSLLNSSEFLTRR